MNPLSQPQKEIVMPVVNIAGAVIAVIGAITEVTNIADLNFCSRIALLQYGAIFNCRK
jgi:hypothetical protein